MKTMVELADNDALWAHVRSLLQPYGVEVRTIVIMNYLNEPDERIDWPQTFIVKVPNYGVVGFTDQMPPR